MSRAGAYAKAAADGFTTSVGIVTYDGTLTDEQAAELKHKWKYGNRPEWTGPWRLDKSACCWWRAYKILNGFGQRMVFVDGPTK